MAIPAYPSSITEILVFLFRFLMHRVLLAMLAMLVHFEPCLQGFLIFLGKIVHCLAFCAFQLDHVVLTHMSTDYHGLETDPHG